MPYITPDRFRVMGFGVDLSDIDDADFAFVCDRASSLVDAYCNIPILPTRHDFRGGVIRKEQHRWRIGDPNVMLSTLDVGTRRVYPLHGPIGDITSFAVKFTNTYQVTIDPANLYVNKTEGWAEVVSLAAVVTGIYPVGINFGLYTPVAEIDYSYGWTFDAAEERLVNDDGQTWRASNQFWDTSTTTPVIKVNGVTQTNNYTVDAYEGRVIFPSALAADAIVTATYRFTLPSDIRDATAYVIADILSDRELRQRGMGRLGQVRIAELEMTRETYGLGGPAQKAAESGVPFEAKTLLEPFRFLTAR